MAHAFNVIPAKPTFGTIRQQLYQSDYIKRKKGLSLYCNSPICKTNKVASSYEKINLFNSVNLGRCTNKIQYFNLISGQYTKMNLKDVCSVSRGHPPTEPCSSSLPCNPCQDERPVIIDSTEPFYYNHTIDPLGELFGRSQCGELNYSSYRVVYL
jgi:hypothetical protein